MLSLGLKSMEAYCLRVNALIEGLLLKSLHHKVVIVQRILVGVFLPIISSLIFPAWVSAIFVLMSIYLTYISMRSIQRVIFEYGRMDIQLYITFPFYFIFLSWGLALVSCDRSAQFGATLASMFFLNLSGIWPVFRSRKRFDDHKRKTSFGNVYFVVSALIAFYQVAILWSYL